MNYVTLQQPWLDPFVRTQRLNVTTFTGHNWYTIIVTVSLVNYVTLQLPRLDPFLCTRLLSITNIYRP
jgi:hypothetical protein